jgi:hypothetical protein
MATEYRVYDYPGGIAGEDFSATGGLLGYQSTGQFLIVAFQAANGVSGAGTEDTFVHYQNNYAITDQPPMGVSQNNPVNGGELAVRMLGRSKLTAGGATNVGDMIGSDASGRGIKKRPSQSGANLGDWVIGVCSHAAGAAGELMGLELIRAYQV